MSYATNKETEAKHIIEQLLHHGHQAYFVGGYVRDQLLKRDIQDIDIATSALPQEVMDIFPHTAPTGLQHGTVTVIAGHHAFEVTTFRSESEYDDFRRPKRVHFIDDLIEDLQRRDFTINAMAMDREGNVIDPFHGLADLQERKLQCVGEPAQRFKEDALRMMRCIRFAANYELNIESSTWAAILAHKSTLQHIAMERIRVELEKTIEGAAPHRGIELLVDSHLINHFKVDLMIPDGAFQQCLQQRVGQVIFKLKNNSSKWAALFIAMKLSSVEVKSILRKLTFSRKNMLGIVSILAFQEWFVQTDQLERDWKTGCLEFGAEALKDWYHIWRIMDQSTGNSKFDPVSFEQVIHHGLAWIEDIPVLEIKDLQITGSDLLQRGLKPGAWIGELLNKLLLDTALLRVANEHDALLNHAHKLMEELKLK